VKTVTKYEGSNNNKMCIRSCFINSRKQRVKHGDFSGPRVFIKQTLNPFFFTILLSRHVVYSTFLQKYIYIYIFYMFEELSVLTLALFLSCLALVCCKCVFEELEIAQPFASFVRRRVDIGKSLIRHAVQFSRSITRYCAKFTSSTYELFTYILRATPPSPHKRGSINIQRRSSSIFLPALILLRRISSSSRVEEDSTSSGEGGLPHIVPPVQLQLNEYSHTVNPKHKYSCQDVSLNEYTHSYTNHNTITDDISCTCETETEEESNVSTDFTSVTFTEPKNTTATPESTKDTTNHRHVILEVGG